MATPTQQTIKNVFTLSRCDLLIFSGCRLMGSRLKGSFGNWIKLNQIYQSQIRLLGVSSSFTYWYHSVNGITLGLALSDPIKWLSLCFAFYLTYVSCAPSINSYHTKH